MFRPGSLNSFVLALGILFFAASAYAQAPQVTSFSPQTRYSMQNATNTVVSVQFDIALDAATVTSQNFRVYGERSGLHAGIYNYSAGSLTASFTPSLPFEPGERVTAILTKSITSSTGTPLALSFAWEFFVQVSAGTGKFSLDSTYTTGNRPNYVGVADINKDTHLDLAVISSNDDRAFTFLNLGNGDFTENERVVVGDLPRASAFGDFDADGDVDLAVVNENDQNLTVLFNNGDGTYTANENKAAGQKPVFDATGDLDGDGYLDLVVVNQTDGKVGVYLNDGSGSFNNATTFNAGQLPEAAFIADFDNDGALDIAVSSAGNNTVVLLINNGSGSFGAPSAYPTDQNPRILVGQDYDGDGFIDIATSNRDGNSVSILINNGGSFAAPNNFAAGLGAFSLSSGDMDGDNDADLTVSNREDDTVHMLKNDGSGSFSTDSIYVVRDNVGDEPRAINTGDFNNDGILDFAVSNRNANTLKVFLNGVPPVTNVAPGAPTLNTPADAAFLDPQSAAIVLNWDVPGDADGDPLHFLVEISQNANFSSTVVSADSRNSTSGFSPTPPVAQGNSTVSYTVSANLNDGAHWWRVSAHDGTLFGANATARKFTVDTTQPTIDSATLTNPTPTFAPNWYNTNSVAATNLLVQYDESNADRAVLNFGTLGGIQTQNNISSGVDQTVQRQINIGSAADGTYTLIATIIDSANNQTSTNAQIALDGAPPTGTLADSPVRSQTLAFTVSWGGGSDGTGSGLAGAFDVRVQTNGGAWTNWQTGTSATSATFTGVNENTYGFEAVAHDNVGNVESFSNVAETTTEVNTTVDSTPPDAPSSLTASGANPSPWQSNENFAIAWQNPSDESGIARALYKLGTPPTADFDTTASAAGVTTFLIAATQENGQNLYVWLQDNSDNTDFGNNSVVNLRHDATPPSNTQASSPSLSSELRFDVTWVGSGSDGSGSGLSGVYDIRMQDNGGQFTVLEAGFLGTSTRFTGLQGHTYGFEVAAHDVAGNIEAFSATAEATTEVDTTARDTEAPGPPTSLLANGANPSPWQNSAQFAVTWQPPQDPSGIEAAYYKLGNPPTANFDTTGSVRSGSSFNATVSVAEGQDFHLWFEDQSGNVDFNNRGSVSLRYDNTAPRIFELDLSNGDFFPATGTGPLAWYNQAGKDSADFLLEYEEDHVASITVESVELDTFITVQNPQSGQDVARNFKFGIGAKTDGEYEVMVAISDSAGNVTRDSTLFGLDTAPPAGTTVIAPDTSRNEIFSVSWAGGSDAGAGLSGFYSIQVRTNGGDWESWLTDVEQTSSQYIGDHGETYDFEAVAFDNVGNVEAFINEAEATTVVDTGFADSVFPTIAHDTPLVVDEGRDTTIVARIRDNAQIAEALFFYKASTASSYQSVRMVSTGNDTFKAAITAEQLTTVGINYYIRATDGVNQTTLPTNFEEQPFNLSVRITGTDSRGVVKTTAQPSGTKATAFRMISVPLNLDNRKPLEVLEDDLGSYDPKNWRLFQFQTTSGTYNEHPNVGEFKPGTAMWLIVKDAGKTIGSGIGASVVTNGPFEITLSEGWNDIGNPFGFAIPATNVVVVSGDANDVVGPYTWQEQWQLPSSVSTLQPWEGYSYFSQSDGVKIAIYPTTPPAGLQALPFSQTGFDGTGWSIGIRATAGEFKDEGARIGIEPTALPDWDRFDYPQPPFIGEFLTVRFRHEDWSNKQTTFKTDIRPPAADGYVWSFEVATSEKGERIRLQFDDLETLPDGHEVVLLDKSTYRQIDLSRNQAYKFTPDHSTLTREFDLVVGTSDYVANSDALSDPIPSSFALSQNFPNPFNAGTTMLYQLPEASKVSIKVLNVIGQEVRQLVNEQKEAGVHRVHWDGRGERGFELSTGIYFIRLHADRFQQIRKVLFVR